MKKRSCYCNELTKSNLSQQVVLSGWVHSIRDHGGLIFIDLRDRSGIVQIVFNPGTEIFNIAQNVKPEYVLNIVGVVSLRPAGTENPKLATGEIEVIVIEIEILNESKTPPFEISEYIDVSEEVRLRYRYFDLRRTRLQQNLITRHRLYQSTREYLNQYGFLEIETPFLTKSTPEGARDFLVPSRLNWGKFYALPQSPQLFKQLLMCGGMEKYYQIVRCFRDEDLRADRQPEFTQIDLEMSFIDEEDIIILCEGLMRTIFKKILETDLPTPFPRLKYSDAMLYYGSDKPDLRFAMKIVDLSDTVKDCGFKVFADTITRGGVVRGVNVTGGAKFSRQEIDNLTKFVNELGAKGLAWMKVTDQGVESSITKFFTVEQLKNIQTKMQSQSGDIMFFIADNESLTATCLGQLRLHLATKLGLIPKDSSQFIFSWIIDFPLFEYSAEEKRWTANHHPFTAPQEEDFAKLDIDSASKQIRARAYDLVLNGQEIGGGSIRIHKRSMQEKVFNLLSISAEEAKERFGFLLEALEYGAPPHGGIAFGLDRLTAIICGEDSIRETIAFPKTQKAFCPLTGAPDTVKDKQLRELGIKIV